MASNGVKRIIITFISIIAFVWAVVFYFIPAFSGRIAVSSGFQIAGFSIHYYGILMAMAILVCFFISIKLSPRLGIDPIRVEEAFPWLVFFGFLGARLYFVIFSWDHFQDRLFEVVQIWKGGFSIYGAIIGAAIGLVLYAKKNSLPVRNFFDLIALSAPLGQAIGRFGNFFNQEAFGYPTNLPWKLYVSPANRPGNYLTDKFFHPAFLYEALWNLAVLAVMFWLLRSRAQDSKNAGQIFGIYLILYSIGRFFIEGLRLDSFMSGSLRIDQITALLMCAAGLVIISYHGRQPNTN